MAYFAGRRLLTLEQEAQARLARRFCPANLAGSEWHRRKTCGQALQLMQAPARVSGTWLGCGVHGECHWEAAFDLADLKRCRREERDE